MEFTSGHKIPISAVIPTSNRISSLRITLQSLTEQNFQPYEIIIIDASTDNSTYNLCRTGIEGLTSTITWYKAIVKGAAPQRNQGTEIASCKYILYMDDDIILDKNCIENLWNGFHNNERVGGTGAIVLNQLYQRPGRISRFMYQFMSGVKLESYAGKCLGPAWNIWPEYKTGQPKYVRVEWLSTVCVLYNKDALPKPVFPAIFQGYSYMEDVFLSLTVAKTNELYIVSDAKIIHNSQPGIHKKSNYSISKMQFINRHFIMRNVLERHSSKDYVKLIILEFFMAASKIKNIKAFFPYFLGKISACFSITSAAIFSNNSNKF